MLFGKRVRELREQRGLTQRELARRLDVSTSYVNKVENGKLHSGDYPSEKFIHKVAGELNADEEELLLLADKVPERLRRRIRERPEAFRMIAELSNRALNELLHKIEPE